MAHAFRLAGSVHEAWLSRTSGGYDLHVDDKRVPVALRGGGGSAQELMVGDKSLPVHVAVRGDTVHVHLNGEAYTLTHCDDLLRFASSAEGRSDAVSRAPMPGAVIALHAQRGQAVKRGDPLLVIESMKMETVICAGVDGTVQAVHVQQGQTFERDAVLVTLSPAEAA